jgi:hypothetical protein
MESMSDLDFPNTTDSPTRQLVQALAFAAIAALLFYWVAEMLKATEPQAPIGRDGEVVRHRAVSSNGAAYGQ